MPSSPTIAMLRPYDPVLTIIASKFIQAPANFVADQVFPVVPVGQISGQIFTYDRSDWFRDDAAPRAPAKESQGGGYDMGVALYGCKEWAWHKDVADEEREQAIPPADPDRDAVEWITQILRIRRERVWERAFFRAGVWGTDWTGVAGVPAALQVRQWSDYVNSNPITDTENIIDQFITATGFEPNVMAIGRPAWRALRNHPLIVARYIASSAGAPSLTEAQVAAVLGIPKLVVGKAAYTATPKGVAPTVYQGILGRHALVAYAPSAPSLSVPSAGYCYNYTGGSRGGFNSVIKRYRLANDADADRLTGSIVVDMHQLETVLGLFIENVVA